MPTADDVLSVAYAELGYRESGNNDNKFGQEYGLNYQPWCCIFVWWCFKHAGASQLFYGGNKVASCTSLWNYYKNRGQTYSDIKQAQPGDIVIYSAGNIHHVGIFYRQVNGGFQTIDGNYGDKVSIHTASWGTPYGIIKVSYDGRRSIAVEEDPEAKFKLGNILVPTDGSHYKGQLAVGDTNDKCIQLKMLDPETKQLRRITKVVNVSTSGRIAVLSRYLKSISTDASQRILHAVYNLDRGYDFNIYQQGAFKIKILFSAIRPNGCYRPINIISNLLDSCGWKLELTTNNHIRFYQSTKSSSVAPPKIQDVVWTDVTINTTPTKHAKVDPDTGLEIEGEYCTTGMFWYELELYKPEQSEDIQIKVDGVEFTVQTFSPTTTQLRAMDKNKSGTRQIKFGEVFNSEPVVFFADCIELKGSRDNDKHNETYTGSLNYNLGSDYTHDVFGGNIEFDSLGVSTI